MHFQPFRDSNFTNFIMHYGPFCLLPKLPFKPWPNGTPNSGYLQPSYKAFIDGWPNGTHKNTQLFQGSLTLVPGVFILENLWDQGTSVPTSLASEAQPVRSTNSCERFTWCSQRGVCQHFVKAVSRLGDSSLSCFLSKSLVAMAQLLNLWLGPEYVYCIRIRTHF